MGREGAFILGLMVGAVMMAVVMMWLIYGDFFSSVRLGVPL